jgi:hypothetical protein
MMEAAILPYSVFHVSGHGTGSSVGDCFYRSEQPYYDYEWLDENANFGYEISGAIANKATGQCQYNFVFLDTCLSAIESDLYNGFGTTAFVGWQENQWSGGNWDTFVDVFYDSLSAKKTVAQSVTDGADATDNEVSGYAYGQGGYRVHNTYPSV